MPNSIPNKFLCECGQVLINHYPNQIIKHRLSKKHAYKLLDLIKLKPEKEINKELKNGIIIVNFD